MLRRSYALLALSLAAAPLSARAQGTQDRDPDHKQSGGGLPSGWMGRTDKANTKIEDAKFTVSGSTYHVVSGPAAIYWQAANKVSGPFTASATFTQTKAPMHPEAYGIFFMGSKLDAPDQSYAYLIVRGDGKVMVKHRAGADLHTIIDWTAIAAVNKADANGRASNTLKVDASKADSVRLFVNNAPVAAIGKAHMGSADGYVGIRVNHNLDVEVSNFTITPKSATAGKTAALKKVGKVAK